MKVKVEHRVVRRSNFLEFLQSLRIGILTEIAVAVAMAAVLDLFKIPLPHLLYGGSVSLETLPIFVIGFRHGARMGLLCGAVYGMVNFIIRPVVVHPIQLLFDYPLAFALLGWGGGIWRGDDLAVSTDVNWRGRVRLGCGILTGNGLRLCIHFISGVVFFAAYAPPDQAVWIYSLTYNASYIVPQMILHILLLQILLRVILLRKG